MPHDSPTLTLQSTRDDVRIAHLAALAMAVHVLEAALPSPIPGVKPGLANIVTVAVLCRFGWSTAAWITALRVLAGSLVVGSFLSPTFLLSAAGAAASLLALRLTVRLPGAGPLGHSVAAAMAHMLGQFAVARTLLIPHPALTALLPVLLTAAVVFGTVNGIMARAALERLQWRPGGRRPRPASPEVPSE